MRCLVCLLLSLSLPLPLAQAADITLVSAKPGVSPVVEAALPKETVAKLKAAKPTPKQWHETFRVVVGGGKPDEVLARPALTGTYTLTDTGIRFEPQFPLVPGLEYLAILNVGAKPVEVSLTVPKPPPGPPVSVAAVYPSANRLPENALRFYIQFSGPVARGDVYRHLKLIRDDGVEVKDPFLELPQELWSTEGNRLTVFFHPGRVKRGLVPREEEGPILEEGRTYTLSISGKWEDAEGRPLTSEFRKTFAVGPPDEQAIDLDLWAVMAPRGGTDLPLNVKLLSPLDYALLGRMVWVTDAAGKPVPGELTVGGAERALTFTPKQPWAKGEYRLVADTRLEDVCGNRVNRAFEVQEGEPETSKSKATTAERKFTVR